MKVGLVLEGGAMRGLFTAGVLDAFMEQGLSFDGMVGVSAGAVRSHPSRRFFGARAID